MAECMLILNRGNGRVGLFKNTDKSSEFPGLSYIAVKEPLQLNLSSLMVEARAHWALQQGNSQHIVALLKEPSEVGGRIERMLLEYLPLGSLEFLLDRRASM